MDTQDQAPAEDEPITITHQVEIVAHICHQAHRALCQALGDNSQLDWDLAPEWQRAISISGVRFHSLNPGASLAVAHENWISQKQADGWTYGPVKDAEAMTDPCMVPFDELPPEQQAKDYVFKAIVNAHDINLAVA